MKHRAEYSKIVEDWRRSGLSRADYCQAHRYVPSTLDGWIKKMSRPAGQSKSTKGKIKVLRKQIQSLDSVLVPLKIENATIVPISPTFELRYPNGVSLSMSSLPATEELSRMVHLYRPELCSR